MPADETAKTNPVEDEFKKVRTADNAVESAFQEINDSMEEAKALAPKAGGDAQKALSDVVELLNGAGETMDDYEPAASTLADFTKDFTAQDDRRIKAIKTCNDALAKIGDASDVVTDLLANVPAEYKKDLQAVSDNIDQAQSDLQEAIVSMGGKVVDDRVTESVDPDQEKSKIK